MPGVYKAGIFAVGLLCIALVAGCKGADAISDTSTPAEIWKSTCSRCHSFDGTGTNRLGRPIDMSLPSWQREKTDAEIEKIIREGKRNERGGIMEGYGARLSDTQIKGLVEYIRKEIGPKKPTP